MCSFVQIAMTDKPKPGSEDPKERIEELEAQLAAVSAGSLLAKKDFEDRLEEYKKQAHADTVKARVLEQKLSDVRTGDWFRCRGPSVTNGHLLA
jgi:hypothetical protein